MTTISAAEPSRRDFLLVATGTVAAVGAAAALVPLIGQMEPDASTIAAGGPLEVNLAPIAEGQIVKVFWRSKPIFIFHRSKRDIDSAREVNWHTLPDPAPDSARVLMTTDAGRISFTHELKRAATEPSLMRFSISGRTQYLIVDLSSAARWIRVTSTPDR